MGTSEHKTKQELNSYKRIIDSTIKLCEKKSYDKITIREICADAGVSIGTFYYCFESKEALYSAKMEEANKRSGLDCAAQMKGKNYLEQIHIFIEYYAHMNEHAGIENCRMIFKTNAAWFTVAHPLLSTLEVCIRDGQQDNFFTKALPPEEMASILHSMLRGAVYNWCMTNGAFNLETRLCQIGKIFVHYISTTL